MQDRPDDQAALAGLFNLLALLPAILLFGAAAVGAIMTIVGII